MHPRRAQARRRQGAERVLRAARDRMVPDRAAAETRARGARKRRGPRAEAGRRGRVRRRHRRGRSPASCGQSQGARARNGRLNMAPIDLLSFARAVSSGAVRVVDLTQTLAQEFPTIVLPPELGQCAPFRIEEVSRYDERGPAWYWNNISLGEHTGTHFDAPIHWVSGKDLPNNAVDTIDVRKFIAPACVIDCSKECAANPDFALTIPFVEQWEAHYGKIEAGSWVLLRTDWSKRSYPDYAGLREDGAHTPGPEPAVVKWFVEQRDVHGFGTETIGTDFGQGHHFNPPYPAHFYMHGKGRFGLQCLTNLDLLPPKGAVIIAAPLKIKQGSGSPLRVLALLAGGAK